MNKKILPIIAAVILIIGATVFFQIYRSAAGSSAGIEGSGTIEIVEIDLSSKIAGRVAELPKAEGEQIAKDELAAKLEYTELSAQQNSARANFENSEKNLQRSRTLFASGSISRRDLDNAETSYTIARAQLDQVSANITHAVITSPVSGIVLTTNLEVGEMAFPGTPVLTVGDITRPWMYLYVSEKELGRIKIGQRAWVMVDSFPGKKFEGKVVSISNKAEFTPKTIQTKDERVKLVFRVKIAIANSDGSLKPGMPADALIDRSTEE